MNARAQDGPIESYLDALLSACAGLPPREVRRLLAESEAHLYDEVESLLCTGVRESEAQERAVARFGSARAIAHAERDRSRVPLLAIARQIVGSAVLVGSIGAVAVGISGLLAAIFRAVGGARFVAGDPSGGALTGAACARWLQLDPRAASCAAAAVSDWSSEAVWYRIALGVAGLLVLVVRRWFLSRAAGRTPRLLPSQVSDTVALTLFLAAGVATSALGIEAIANTSGRGSGQWLSAAPVALAAAAVYGVRLTRALRGPSIAGTG